MEEVRRNLDRDFHIDPYLVEDLKFMVYRQSKNWDNCIIIDGDEGTGKTTLSWALGKFLAEQTGRTFDLNSVFFDPDEMMAHARNSNEQIIIWDEAVIAGLATEWQNKTQKKLIKTLMTCRSKRHFWVFIIPKFFKLSEYIAVDRSILLLNVYSPDNITRGYFCAYGQKKKSLIYDTYRNTRKKHYDWFNYKARFPKYYSEILNNDAYEAKKADAISKMDDDEKKSATKQKLDKTLYLTSQLSKVFPLTKENIATHYGVDVKTVYRWSKLNEND